MSKRVYPVEGVYLNDVPHVEHDCDDPNCVKSGAFTDKPPSKASTKAPDKPGPSDSSEEK